MKTMLNRISLIIFLATFCFTIGCKNLTGRSNNDDKTSIGLLLMLMNSSSQCTVVLMGGKSSCPLSLSGIVSTIAGPAPGTTTSGDTDATGNAARFNTPYAITTEGTNLYIADFTNNKIRKVVIATGVVTTLAGPAPGATTSGDTDATGNAARFNRPTGLTTDGTNLYVTDSNNNKIRKIVIATGVVTTLAGPAQGATTSGDTDATGNASRFTLPFDITTDGTNLFVADFSNRKIG